MASQRYDVAVIGAGAAGIAASVCSARKGLKTLLVEASDSLGGVFVAGHGTTICGLYVDDNARRPAPANEGFPEEFTACLMQIDNLTEPVRMGRTWVLPCRTRSFLKVAHILIGRERALSLALGSSFLGLEHEGREIRRLRIRQGANRLLCDVGVVIDCTGSALACRSAGEQSMGPNRRMLSPAIAFTVGGMRGGALALGNVPRILLKLSHAVKAGRLPKGTDCVSFMPSLESGVLTLRLDLGIAARKAQSAVGMASDLFAFLKANVPEFGRARMSSRISPVLDRTSRRLRGRYVLTSGDVMNARKFKDGMVRCSWPVEMWGAGGRPKFQYLDPGQYYEIPAGSLVARRFDNLFVAGRCISADDKAIASARVVGACLATGEAAATLAGKVQW
jgi:hypothetical protein